MYNTDNSFDNGLKYILKHYILTNIFSWIGLNFASFIMPVKLKFMFFTSDSYVTLLLGSYWFPAAYRVTIRLLLHLRCVIISPQRTILSPSLDPICPWVIWSCHMVPSFPLKYLKYKAWPVCAHSVPEASKHRMMPCLHTNPSKFIQASNIFTKLFSIPLNFYNFFCFFSVARHFATMHSPFLMFYSYSCLTHEYTNTFREAISYNFLCVSPYLSKDIVDPQ